MKVTEFTKTRHGNIPHLMAAGIRMPVLVDTLDPELLPSPVMHGNRYLFAAPGGQVVAGPGLKRAA